MQTQTIADLKRAMAVKLSLTSKGYKATVKADTPDEAIVLAKKAHSMLLDLKNRLAGPVEKDRSDYPVLVLAEPCAKCKGLGLVPVTAVEEDPLDLGGNVTCPTCRGKHRTGYLLKHGSGPATPWDPRMQKLESDWVVKIDLELNSKGLGTDVEVQTYPMEAGIALIEYTERALAEAFNPPAATEAKGA